jgi:hypothetical protein
MSDILTQIKSTADILGGDVFFATAEGQDPEILENDGLLANGMYIRLNGSDGSVAYISAFELDKSIEIIDQITKGKANQEDFEVFQLLMDEKANQSDLELLQSDISTKASQESIDSIITILNSKVDSSVVDALSTAVSSKAYNSVVDALSTAVSSKADNSVVDALSTAVSSKADSSVVSSIQNDVNTLKATIDSITDEATIEAIQNQIEYLNNELNKKLTQDSLTEINSDIDNIQLNVDSINERLLSTESNVLKKAEKTFVQGQLNEIHDVLANMVTTIDSKANKTLVAEKANKTDVDNLRSKVVELNTLVGTKVSSLDASYQTLVNNVSSKANKSETESAITSINNALSNKADLLETARSINTINAKITSLENKDDGLSDINNAMSSLQTNVNAAIHEMNSIINSQTKQITDHTTKISKLQETDSAYAESLKNEWVRVITPEEYKKLPAIGSLLPNGSPNPKAKKPNTIYMLVRYNKPISVYIGDILIAQAEQKGSTGFAYTFPITF